MFVSNYSKLRVLLHWMSAAVILWALVSGFYVAGVDVPSQTKAWVGFVNVSLTTVFIPLFVWRLFLSVREARVVSVTTLSRMEKVALFVHVLIYLTVSLVLITGVLMMERPINIFAVVQVAQPLTDPTLTALFFTVHIAACLFLSLLIVLHLAAVVFHEICGHRVMRRMSLRQRDALLQMNLR